MSVVHVSQTFICWGSNHLRQYFVVECSLQMIGIPLNLNGYISAIFQKLTWNWAAITSFSWWPQGMKLLASEHGRQNLVNRDTINLVQSEFVSTSRNSEINIESSLISTKWNIKLETCAEISFSHDTFFFKLHSPFLVEAAPDSSLARSVSAKFRY